MSSFTLKNTGDDYSLFIDIAALKNIDRNSSERELAGLILAAIASKNPEAMKLNRYKEASFSEAIIEGGVRVIKKRADKGGKTDISYKITISDAIRQKLNAINGLNIPVSITELTVKLSHSAALVEAEKDKNNKVWRFYQPRSPIYDPQKNDADIPVAPQYLGEGTDGQSFRGVVEYFNNNIYHADHATVKRVKSKDATLARSLASFLDTEGKKYSVVMAEDSHRTTNLGGVITANDPQAKSKKFQYGDRHMSGIPLSDYISENPDAIGEYKRFEILKAILVTLRDEFHNKGYAHTKLSLQNIIIDDCGDDGVKVNICGKERVAVIGSTRRSTYFRPLYDAPETKSRTISASKQLDLFAIGVIAVQLFKGTKYVPQQAYRAHKSIQSVFKSDNDLKLPTRYADKSESEVHIDNNFHSNSKVRGLLNKLLHNETSKRYKNCDAVLNDIYAMEYKPGAGAKSAVIASDIAAVAAVVIGIVACVITTGATIPIILTAAASAVFFFNLLGPTRTAFADEREERSDFAIPSAI